MEVKSFKGKVLHRFNQIARDHTNSTQGFGSKTENKDEDLRWQHHRLNRLVAEYLLRLGFFQTADLLLDQCAIKVRQEAIKFFYHLA